jgi:lactoylglutathione lyase
MKTSPRRGDNVEGLVPLLHVNSMERSLSYYVERLGFTMTRDWVVEGKVRWCRLELGAATVMLQEVAKAPAGSLGEGASFWFECKDALVMYDDFKSRELEASEPEVGNAMWYTTLFDPDGHRLHFVSATDVPEDTKLSEVKPSLA